MQTRNKTRRDLVNILVSGLSITEIQGILTLMEEHEVINIKELLQSYYSSGYNVGFNSGFNDADSRYRYPDSMGR